MYRINILLNENINKVLQIMFQIRPMTGTVSLPDLADVVPTGEIIDINADHKIITYVLFIHIISAYLCYIFGKLMINIFFNILKKNVLIGFGIIIN